MIREYHDGKWQEEKGNPTEEPYYGSYGVGILPHRTTCTLNKLLEIWQRKTIEGEESEPTVFLCTQCIWQVQEYPQSPVAHFKISARDRRVY